MNITYDWVKSNWTVLPLGVKVAKLVKFGKLPVQFSGAYEYNFQDDFAAPQVGGEFYGEVFVPDITNRTLRARFVINHSQ